MPKRLGWSAPLLRIQVEALVKQVDEQGKLTALGLGHAFDIAYKSRAEIARRLREGKDADDGLGEVEISGVMTQRCLVRMRVSSKRTRRWRLGTVCG